MFKDLVCQFGEDRIRDKTCYKLAKLSVEFLPSRRQFAKKVQVKCHSHFARHHGPSSTV